MEKIPDTAQPWAEVSPYGKVFLRKFSSFAMIKIYRCVQDAANPVIPHLLEYYHFIAPLGDDGLMGRLRLMGYPENLYVAGLDESSGGGQTFIAVTQYGGTTLGKALARLKEDGEVNKLKAVMRSVGVCFGTLHQAGIICDDTHPNQFVVDDSLVVRRIDVHQSRVHMDVVPDHPVFGGLNETYFEHRRLTPHGFEVGVRNELRLAIMLAKLLDKELFITDDATKECRNGYLDAGGAMEGWQSGELAFKEAASRH